MVIDPRAGKVTLDAYGKAWLAARADLRPTTIALYESLLRRFIVPKLGPVELGGLDAATVRAWHAGLLRDHPGASSIPKAWALDRLDSGADLASVRDGWPAIAGRELRAIGEMGDPP